MDMTMGVELGGLPNTPATSAAAKSTLPKKIQGPATSAAAKSTLPKNVQGHATECSELTIVPAITRASKKIKKTTKAPIEQSIAEKEKADIRKRLHLLKDDIYTMVIMFFSSFAQIMEGDSSWILWEPRKTKEDYYLVKQLERVVGHLSWVLYFVLKYQHDDFPNILPWGAERPLLLSEIDAVVNAWFSLWRDYDQ
ncbi:hypothetical protein Tco_0209239 [Tanacetum coccineum]